MPRPNKILLIILIVVMVSYFYFIIPVFVRISNVKNTHVNHPSVNYLDIQMQTHHRMYVLILDIDERYQNSPEDIKVLIGYVERLHKEVIILGNSNRLAKITTCAEDPESLRWMSERLIWVTQPMDKVNYKDDKIAVLVVSGEIEYLHTNLRFLAGDRIEEAMARVEEFKNKFQR